MSNHQDPTLQALYRTALRLPQRERDRYLFERCKGNWDLFQKLREGILSPVSPGFNGSSPDSSSLRTRSGRYTIRGVLGEGGMGVVYLADQEWPVKRRVALKILRDTRHSRKARSRFRAERQALALMDHPNIARVYEAGSTADGRLFLVMEHASGRPITEFCRDGEIPLAGRIQLLLQVCHGIAHAHQKGVIHRDIKPSNILVANGDGRPVVKIIDFGVAESMDSLRSGAAGSGSREIMGTLNYMSPEQADSRILGVDTRSDIYSLGTVAYETLTGSVLLDLGSTTGKNVREIVDLITRSIPELPSTRALKAGNRAWSGRLRNDLDWVVMKTLEKDPAKRYQTANDLAADLERYLSRIPVAAAPPRLRGYRTRLYLRRHRTLAATLCSVAAAAFLGILATNFLSRSLAASAAVATEQKSQILRLSDAMLLKEYLAEVDDLVPPHPEMIGAMEAWLEKANRLAERLPLHRRTLASLRQPAGGKRTDGAQPAAPSGVEAEFYHDLLSSLISDLETFTDPDPHVGAVARIEKRLEFAQTVRQRSIEAHAADWNAAIAAMRDTARCPLYHGLVIPAQMGLVPLRRNPRTTLWEFVDLATGAPPERDGDGNIALKEDTGVILVLVPGGRFWMGAPKELPTDPILSDTATDYFSQERPGHYVDLDPYFISKYELTQAQWIRLTGTNPSGVVPGGEDPRVTFLNPVDHVTWNEASQVLSQAGLVLPTEAQWECAARAGTETPWWTGALWRSVEGTGNFSDRSAGVDWGKFNVPWNDGFPDTAPVGSFKPNPFGLYDVNGNVREWCLDSYSTGYPYPHCKGDGLQLFTNGDKRTCRGGSYQHPPTVSRSGFRWAFSATDRDIIGIRPARRVDYGPEVVAAQPPVPSR